MKSKIQIGPNQQIQVGPDRVIQLSADQALSYQRGTDPTIHIVPAHEILAKDLTAEFKATSIFSNKVKMVKLAHGFINDDFIFQSEQKSDLSSERIVEIMEPALKYHSRNKKN